jgi:nucleotide-binding universal stress UspA family protein
METSILCGVDGSADSEAALGVARRLADRLDARLVLANVVEPIPGPSGTVGTIGFGNVARTALTDEVGERVRGAERLLEEMAERLNLRTADRRVIAGFAAERLADLADEETAELIVVGSRGRGAFKAAFLGSVSTSLIGVARCPVLVVPAGVTES